MLYLSSNSRLSKAIGMIMLMSMIVLPLQANAAIEYTIYLDKQSISLDTIQSPDGHKYLKIEGKNLWEQGEEGHPAIPFTVVRFQVPENATDFSVKINNMANITAIQPEFRLFPVQKAISLNDYSPDMFTAPDETIYESYSSSFNAKILDESWLEGRYHIVTVAIDPFAYNAVENKLEICKKVGISLDYVEKATAKRKKKSNETRGFIDIANVVVNANSFGIDKAKSAASSENFGRNLNTDEEIEPERYYIISERSLLPALQELATWKRQKGYDVIMKAIEDIYEDTLYKINPSNGIVDEAASLRKYLQDESDDYSPFFCLLVGDHNTKMPIRKLSTKESSKYTIHNFNGDNYVPTDNYFSDLSYNNWNIYEDANKKYVGLLDKTPYSPTIYVGRLLCNTETEINNYISKLILYETNPGRGDTEYLNKSAVSVQQHCGNVYGPVLDIMKQYFTDVDVLLDSNISNPGAGCSPTGEMIIKQMNNLGYISLIAHGEPSTIACSGRDSWSKEWQYIKALDSYSYDSANSLNSQTQIKNNCINSGLDKLVNIDYPSIIYTEACTTAPFDIYDSDGFIFDIPHTMASSFTVGGSYGGVAYLGYTRVAYTYDAPKLESLFVESLQDNPKIGIAESLSKYLHNNNSAIGRHDRHAHNLIGDPELTVWNKAPLKLDISLDWGNDYITLNGSDQIESRVVINDGSDDLMCFEYKKPISHNIYYPDDDKLVAVGIYKNGYLPMIMLNSKGGFIKNCNKNFIVREAYLGLSSSNSSCITIDSNADVFIRSIDKAECGSDLVVSNGGILSIKSDKFITVNGSSISNGGRMKLEGERVELSKGFSVGVGCSFSVNNNN